MQETKITQVHGITPNEFRESILNDVKVELQKITEHFQPVAPPEYLTRKEISVILKVSLVTISDWDKKKILTPYRLGSLIRYKRSEIEAALVNINSKK